MPRRDARHLWLINAFQRWRRAAKSELERLTHHIPPPFSDWIADRQQSAAAHLGNELLSAFVGYALLARGFLLSATGAKALRRLTWLVPQQSPPTDWLDELAPIGSPLEEIAREWRDIATGAPLTDPLQAVYERLLPTALRRAHGEFYTPAWLADQVLGFVADDHCAWIDPSVGSGAFLLAHARRFGWDSRTPIVGMDRNPFAVLAAAANAALARHWSSGTVGCDFALPTVIGDPLETSSLAALGSACFDRVVGNPPWIIWDRLSKDFRAGYASQWRNYGLWTESGMSAILGGGKKDLAMLIVYAAVDRLLKNAGKLAFVLTGAALTTSVSGRGFRRWLLPDGVPCRVERVDDFSARRPFGALGALTYAMVLKKGSSTDYPVPFHVWPADAALPPRLTQASPSDPSDPMSAWMRREGANSSILDRVLGTSEFRSHLGVNAGGANGVYWFERLAKLDNGLWRLRNLADRSRTPLPTLEVELEPTYLFPLLTSKDLSAWRASPSAWILFVQDPRRRRGWPIEELSNAAPKTWEYLKSFEAFLRSRAAYRRYYQRADRAGVVRDLAPFYSMFDVGDYTLAAAKVVWRRMGKKLTAAVVASMEGKPILPQETLGFIAAANEDEAHYLAALLNSRWSAVALEATGQVGGKSFATPRRMDQLRLSKHDGGNEASRALVELGRRAGQEAADPAGVAAETQSAIDRWSAAFWRLPASDDA